MKSASKAVSGSYVVAISIGAVILNSTIVLAAEELCTAIEKRSAIENENARYNEAYSAYIEICASSQYKPIGDKDQGGYFGHSFAMIHGACRVEDPVTHVQQLKPCDGGTVGISTDAQYHNAQWSAAEGRDFMLYGGLKPGEKLDRATYEKLLEKAKTEGVLGNIGERFKPWNNKERREQLSTEQEKRASDMDWASRFTLGTDYALTLARSASCTRIPLRGLKPGKENAPLEDVLRYFNDLNQTAYQNSLPKQNGGPSFGYVYDSAVNNCTHTIYNALSRLGLWREKNTEGHPTKIMDQLQRRGDIVAPYNAMFDAYKAGSDLDMNVIIANLRTNPMAMKALKEYGWLGPQAGVMIEDLPVHENGNEVFDTKMVRGFFSVSEQALSLLRTNTGMPIPKFDPLGKQFNAIVSDPNSSAQNLVRNLEDWKAKYEKALRDSRLGGNDEVAVELKKHFQAKLEETNAALNKVAQSNPKIRIAGSERCAPSQPASPEAKPARTQAFAQ